MASVDDPPDLEKRVRKLEKRHEIEETVQKYVRALDSQNSELLGSIFAEDAIAVVIPWGEYEGCEEIVKMYEGFWEEIPLMNHLIANQVIEVTGNEAVVTSYWISNNDSTDNQPVEGGGYYIRELKQRDDDWVHTYFKIDIQYLRPVQGPSVRKVMGFDELRPLPKDNPSFPIPFFPKR